MTDRQFQRTEIVLWGLLALVPIVAFWDPYEVREAGLLYFLTRYFFSSSIGLIALAFLFIPLTFWYIFSRTPLAYFRARKRKGEEVDEEAAEPDELQALDQIEIDETASLEEAPPSEETGDATSEAAIVVDIALRRLDEAVYRSRAAKNTALRRANVQLFAGALIGLLGLVAFFALESAFSESDMPELKGVWQMAAWRFLETLPRITVLVFIELMAGFFLRQYRIAMEEYRYFEKSFREQELLRVSYLIRRDHSERSELLKLSHLLVESRSSGVLQEGETTQILEVQKMASNEFQGLYDRVLETVETAISAAQRLKGKEKAANQQLETDG